MKKIKRRRRAKVIDLELYRERRRRIQLRCGHSIAAWGRCSYCGAFVPARCEQVPMFDEPA